MNNYLKKENWLYSSLSITGKKVYKTINIASIVLFVLASFSIFEFMYILCNLIGAVVSGAPYEMIHEIKRILPLLLMYSSLIMLSFLFNNIIRKENKEKYLIKMSISLIIINFISLVFIIINLVNNTYESLVEGYPSYLFPLDVLLLTLLILTLSILVIVKKNLIVKCLNEINYVKCSKIKSNKVLCQILHIILYFLVLYAFAAFIHGIFTIDFKHGHQFYGVTLLLVLLFTVLEFVQVKFIYQGLKEEVKYDYLKLVSMHTLLINVFVYLLWFIAMILDHNGLNQTAYGILAIEYTASVGVGTYLYLLALVVAPLILFIKTRRNNEKSSNTN